MTRQTGGENSSASEKSKEPHPTNSQLLVSSPQPPPQKILLPLEVQLSPEQFPKNRNMSQKTSTQVISVTSKRQNLNLTEHPPRMSKAKLNEFREAFMLFDKDGDGSITKEELGRVMRNLGQFAREQELQQMLHVLDIDGDGRFSFEEFVQILSSMIGSHTEEDEEKELRDAFRVFDKHNRGYITASDLRAVLQCLGEDLSEEEIEDMIKEVDVDGDGRIDFYEFVHALGEPGENDENESNDEKSLST